jgi:hypothetical protein
MINAEAENRAETPGNAIANLRSDSRNLTNR